MPFLPTRRSFLQGTLGTAGLLVSRLNAAGDQAAGDPAAAPQIVDCHLHINHLGRSIADTVAHMDATGVARAFILPLETGEGGVTLKTETVLHAWHEYPDRIIPFCQSDIRRDDFEARVRAYHLLGCQGVGEQKEHLPLNDRRVEALIALCDELDWPITMHFEDGPNGFNMGLAAHLEGYLKKYQRVRIIGHAQTWWASISADVPGAGYPEGRVRPGGLLDRLLGEYPNVYADLSAHSGYNALTRDRDFTAGFLDRNWRKLIFGSDCPCRDGKGANFKGICYCTRLQTFLKDMISNKDHLQAVLSDNALGVLRRDAQPGEPGT